MFIHTIYGGKIQHDTRLMSTLLLSFLRAFKQWTREMSAPNGVTADDFLSANGKYVSINAYTHEANQSIWAANRTDIICRSDASVYVSVTFIKRV